VPRREPARPEPAAEPAKGTAKADESLQCWAARAVWLKDTPDRPSLGDAGSWVPLITRGRLVARTHQSLAKAVRTEIARVTANDPVTKRVKIVDAAFTKPAFFRDRAGILFLHIAGHGGQPKEKRYDAVFFATKNVASGNWSVTGYNFKSSTLHQLNLDAPLLVERHPLAYLRYFMYIVRGPEGPFRLVDDPEHDWPFSPSRLKRLKAYREASTPKLDERLHVPRFDGVDSGGRLRYKVCVLYAGHFFAADLAVHPNGMVEMVSDQPIAEVPGLKE
jgi:hypothetical protein